MPAWANLAWCGLFVLLANPAWLGLRATVGLAAFGMIPRVLAVAGTAGSVWMLSGLGWLSVMAFYAMTALWPILLVLLARKRAARLAGWMIPVAVLEGAGTLSMMAGTLVGLFLGNLPHLNVRSIAAGAFAGAQILFLVKTARTS